MSRRAPEHCLLRVGRSVQDYPGSKAACLNPPFVMASVEQTVAVAVGTTGVSVTVGGIGVLVAQLGRVKASCSPLLRLAVLQEYWVKRLPVSFWEPIVALTPLPCTAP